MAEVFTIAIVDDLGRELGKAAARNLHGAHGLVHAITTAVLRAMGDIWVSDAVTITIAREKRPDLREMPASSDVDALGDGDLPI